jgi:alpha-N-acetylglucosamine transferase
VLFIDADSIPLKNLDYLFRFPFDGPVAAPKAYWLPQPFWTTALLLVHPSDENWGRLSRHFGTAAFTNSYDMEIVNAEFGSEITTLPLDVFSLNSEWEDRRRPGFFGDFEKSYSKISVVHFTALGKPWFYALEDVHRLRPDAHPVFYRLWESWRTTREELAP